MEQTSGPTKKPAEAVVKDIRGAGLPPEKWSSLRYGSEPFGGRIDVEEAAQA
jgi:hypothetical protein